MAIDSRKRRDGEYIEKVGFYDPNPDPAIITVDREKALKWLGMGAIPSDTVRSFLKRDGIMHEFSLRKRGLDDKQVAEEMKKWEVLQLEKQKKAEAKAAMAKREQEKMAKKQAESAAEAETEAAAEVEAAVEETAENEVTETAAEEQVEAAAEETEEEAESPEEEK